MKWIDGQPENVFGAFLGCFFCVCGIFFGRGLFGNFGFQAAFGGWGRGGFLLTGKAA